MAKINNCKDLIILLLYAKGAKGKSCEPILGRTRLMKMIFLFNEEVRRKFNLGVIIAEKALPDFKPYDYGPFAEQVYIDLEFLVDTGFVKVKHLGNDSEMGEEFPEYQYWQATTGLNDEVEGTSGVDEFSLSEIGKKFVEDGELGELNQEQWDILDKFKTRCTSIPLKALLRYVYAKYPKMTTNSKILEDILKEQDA
jgi:uncharacterized protein YwgA